MSVRNILDGTIKVEGGGTEIGPESDVVCKTLTANNQVACESLNTSALVGDDAQLSTLTVKDEFTAKEGRIAEATITHATITEASIPTLTTKALTANKLSLGGGAALTSQYLGTSEQVTLMFTDTTSTIKTVGVDRTLFTIMPGLQVLTVYLSLSGITPLASAFIPTGFSCSSMLKSWGVTQTYGNNAAKPLATVQVYAKDGKMRVQLDFNSEEEYTTLDIKLVILIH